MSIMRPPSAGPYATSFLVPAMLLLLISSSRALPQADKPAEKQEKQHENEPSKPKNEPRHYLLTVRVLSQLDGKPVAQAEVTVFAGDYQSENKTKVDGTASFVFDTASKNATVRVVADHFQTEQSPITLEAPQKNYTVNLKTSD